MNSHSQVRNQNSSIYWAIKSIWPEHPFALGLGLSQPGCGPYHPYSICRLATFLPHLFPHRGSPSWIFLFISSIDNQGYLKITECLRVTTFVETESRLVGARGKRKRGIGSSCLTDTELLFWEMEESQRSVLQHRECTWPSSLCVQKGIRWCCSY